MEVGAFTVSSDTAPRFITEPVTGSEIPGQESIFDEDSPPERESRQEARKRGDQARKLTDRLTPEDFKPGVIAKGMSRLYTMGGMAGMPFFPGTAKTLIEQADQMGQLYEEWGKSDPAIRAKLLKLIRGSAGGKLMLAHLGIVMTFATELKEKRDEKAYEREASQGVNHAASNPQPEPRREPPNRGGGFEYKVPSHAVV